MKKYAFVLVIVCCLIFAGSANAQENEGVGVRPIPEIEFDLPKLEIKRDSLCYENKNVLGSITAGTVFYEWDQTDDHYVVEHPVYKRNCAIGLESTVEPWPIPDWQLDQIVKWYDYAKEAGDYYDIDPILILAVIAKESKGVHQAVSADGQFSVGLMQITPRDWGCASNELLNWPKINIYCGTLILQDAIRLANIDIDSEYVAPNDFKPENGIRVGLAAYNCGFQSLYGENGKSCMLFGGLAYADNILEFWIPLIYDYLSYKELIE